MFPRRRGRGEGPLACLMTKHFDLKFAASMKLVKARAWRLPVVPPGTSPIDRQPAAINPRPAYHGLSRAGPKVRIHLPPARSQQRTLWLPGASHAGGTQSSNPLCSSSQSVSAVNPEAIGEKPRTLAASARGWGREKGHAGCEPGLLRPFSLTGIDAVPPPEGSDRLQMTRGPR